MKRLVVLALLLSSSAGAQQSPPIDTFAYGQAYVTSSTRASTVSGQSKIVLDSAQNFQNGRYITIFHAGLPCRLSVPSAPTVTPSVDSGGLNTLGGKAGNSVYDYEVVAADKFGCYTAASTAGLTATGTTLGRQTLSISTLTRSNNVVSVATSAPHGLVAGELILISYFSSSDGSFEGYWIVHSIVDSKHFSFLSSMDTRTGATTSATGGTLYAYNANHISWTPVAGAWKYYVYGRTGRTLTLLGQTLNNFYNDFGSPINDNQTFPEYIPTSAPSSGANDHLTTAIVSGAGTTSLTLATRASVSLNGAAAKSDDCPALKAATSIRNGAPVQINFPLTINSYCQLDTADFGYHLNLNGPITANDTLEFDGGVTINGVSAPPPPAFAWSGAAQISGAAYPLIVTTGGANLFRNVTVGMNAQNGYLGLYRPPNGGANDSFDYVYFVGGEGQSNDYIGMLAVFETGGFSFRFNKCLFETSAAGGESETFIGYSPLPSVAFRTRPDGTLTGNWTVEHSWFLYRGAFLQDYTGATGGVSYGYVKDIQTQNQTVPVFEYTNQGGHFGASNLEIEGITPADFPTAMVANLVDGYAFTGLSVLGTTSTQGGHNVFTGNPFSGVSASSGAIVTGINSNVQYNAGTTTALDGVFNTNGSSANPVAQATFNELMMLGSPYSFFTGSPPAAAPTCAVIAGGALKIGTYSFEVAPVFWNGGVGTFSPASSACLTASSKQTITIHWNPVIGARYYYLAVNGTGPLPPNNNCGVPNAYMPGTSTSYNWDGIKTLGSCGGSLPSGIGGGPTMFNSTGIFAPQMLLEPRPFSSLGSPANGVFIYCSDCTITNPCAEGGTGAYAKGLRGAWVCN
jgi:hypothetical protein